MTGLFNAQTLYMLPVSLFGMAVSAAELPAMSSALGDRGEVAAYLRRRLDGGLRQIAFFIVPSAMAFLALGDVIAAALFQRRFHARIRVCLGDSGRLVGGAAGSTLGRLYSSTYYALRDTRTPLRFAVIRVALTTIWLSLRAPVAALDRVDPRWGVRGLTASAGIAGWVEFALLRRTLNRRIGVTGLHAGLHGAALAVRGDCGGGRVAGERRNRIGAPDPVRRSDSWAIWHDLFRRGVCDADTRMPRHAAQIWGMKYHPK